jgi:4-oxalomesaconate hydratase
MAEMGAQGYLREYYTQRASQRANHARRICGNSAIQFAEAFQRVSPAVIWGW